MKITRTGRTLSVLLSLLMVIGMVSISQGKVLADTDAATGLEYAITDGEATITGFTAPAGFTGELMIPETLGGAPVTMIADHLFDYSYELTSIVFPSTLTSIGDNTFSNIDNLTSIIVNPANTVFKSTDGVLYTKDGTQLIRCPRGRSGTFIIPSSVTIIGRLAFHGCSDLTGITIPNGVISISEWAFGYCIGLTSISIPSSVSRINWRAFFGCENLTGITIPSSVAYIDRVRSENAQILRRLP